MSTCGARRVVCTRPARLNRVYVHVQYDVSLCMMAAERACNKGCVNLSVPTALTRAEHTHTHSHYELAIHEWSLQIVTLVTHVFCSFEIEPDAIMIAFPLNVT